MDLIGSQQIDLVTRKVIKAECVRLANAPDGATLQALRGCHALLDLVRQVLDIPLSDDDAAVVLDTALEECVQRYRPQALAGFISAYEGGNKGILLTTEHSTARLVAATGELFDRSDDAALRRIIEVRRPSQVNLNRWRDRAIRDKPHIARRYRALQWYWGRDHVVLDHYKAAERTVKAAKVRFPSAFYEYLNSEEVRERLLTHPVVVRHLAREVANHALTGSRSLEESPELLAAPVPHDVETSGADDTSSTEPTPPVRGSAIAADEPEPASTRQPDTNHLTLRALAANAWSYGRPVLLHGLLPFLCLTPLYILATFAPPPTWPWLWSAQHYLGHALMPVMFASIGILCGLIMLHIRQRTRISIATSLALLIVSSSFAGLLHVNYLLATADATRIAKTTAAWNPVYISHFDNGSSCPPAVSGVPPAVAGDAGCRITDGTLRIDLSTPIGRIIDVGYADPKPTKGDYHVEIRLRAAEGLPLTACGLRLATDEAYFFLHLTATSSRNGIDYAPEMLQLIYNDGTVGTRKPVAPTGRLEQLPFVTRSPQWPGSDYATWTKLAVHKQAGELTLFVNDRLALQAPVAHEYAAPSLAALAGDANHDGLAGCEFDYLKVLAPGG